MWSESSLGALPSSTTDRNSNRRNILIVGDVGVGKSSLINLICGEQRAATSSVATTSTLHSEDSYIVTLQGVEFALYDTVGLHETQGNRKTAVYLDAVHRTYALISALERSGGINLLVFCMKGGRISITMTQIYNLFVEVFCSRLVPVAIVVTHLEMFDDMEEWWRKNQRAIQEYGLGSVGHACITTTRGLDRVFDDKYELSREITRKLLLDYSNRVAWKENPSWVGRVGKQMQTWLSPRRVKQFDSSDMKMKLVKRCGFSVEDAETVARTVEQVRRISRHTLNENKQFLVEQPKSEQSQQISGDTPGADEERSIDENGATEESEQKISSDRPDYSENPWFDEKFGFDSSNCISLPIISYTS